jgi:glycosyltransferase involved in cell wall biosynthesis
MAGWQPAPPLNVAPKVAGTVPVPSALRPEPQIALPLDFRSQGLQADGTPSVPATFYVTFVDPTPRNGVLVFARIADTLSRRRPDIPLLLVENTVRASDLAKLGIDLSVIKNLKLAPNSSASLHFLAATKILLMPSLAENAGLLAAEAMTDGIPVLASNRGALPEIIGGPRPGPLPEGEGGFLFDIPARCTPESCELPTADEVQPWVETIIHLWDDATEYDRWSRAARERSQQWHPERLAPIYREFFASITHQPGPPLVPLKVVMDEQATAAGRAG